MSKILLVEDDLSLGSILHERLSKDHTVIWSKNLVSAWSDFLNHGDIDVALLDVNLPDGSGFDLAKKIKKDKDVPFIFLTAMSDAENRLLGFEIGAEEFIPKPFHLKELILRLEHVLKLHSPTKIYKTDSVTINFTEGHISQANGKIEFPSATDMKILKLLIEASPRVMTRDEIINAVWGIDKMMSHRSIDNIIVRLRHLLNDTTDSYIKSIRGQGYQWLPSQKDTTP